MPQRVVESDMRLCDSYTRVTSSVFYEKSTLDWVSYGNTNLSIIYGLDGTETSVVDILIATKWIIVKYFVSC